MPLNIGILGSTRGTNMQAIQRAIVNKWLEAQISVVISNKADAIILQRAAELGVPGYFLLPGTMSRAEYDARTTAVLMRYDVDVVVLIGYMRILSVEFVTKWHERVINVHPSLLPQYAGLMDRAVYQQVLADGCVETGCTVHLVTRDVDAGPILIQSRCPVLETDTVDTLKQRVQALEGPALVKVLQQYAKAKF